MSTWLSGGLNQFSNITDQISSFTKEVLTETTEEVTDPTAELHVLRQKHDELERSYQHLQSESEKVKEHSTELTERAETAEYQVSTISQEYRKLLEDRDTEIRRLKTENGKLKDQSKGYVYSPINLNSPLKELALDMGPVPPHSQGEAMGGGGQYESVDIGGAGEEWAGHYNDDFSDVISSQSEINRLQSELAKVCLELQHWRNTDKKQSVGSTVESGQETVGYKNQVEDLMLSLHQERDHHHQELTSLQTSHQQMLQSLSERHQHEIGQLQEQIDVLLGKVRGQLQHTVIPQSDEGHKTRELEDLNTSLLSQLNQLKNELRKGQQGDAKLAEKVEAEKACLITEIKTLTEQRIQDKSIQSLSLREDMEKLELSLKEKQEEIVSHQSKMADLLRDHSKCVEHSKELHFQIETLTDKLSEKDKDIECLKKELEIHEEKLQHRVIEGDELLKQMEERARESEERLGMVKEELNSSKIQVETLKLKCHSLEVKDEGELAATGSRQETENDASQILSELIHYKKAFEDKRGELGKAEEARLNSISTLTWKEKEVMFLKEKIESINVQNDEAMSKLLISHEEALKHVETGRIKVLLAGKTMLEGKLQDEQFKGEQQAQRLLTLQEQISKQQENLNMQLSQVKELHSQEKAKAGQMEAELKRQQAEQSEKGQRHEHTMAMEEELQVLREELQVLKGELQLLKEERSSMLFNMKSSQDRAEESSESLKNLQSVLEQFQRDHNKILQKSQGELSSAVTECQRLKDECKSLKSHLEEAREAASVASLLNQELEEKEVKIATLSQEVKELRTSLEEKKAPTHEDKDKAEVDRNLMKNLVLGYVHASHHKKEEVLHLIAKILEFTPAELEQAIGGSGGWLTGFWKAPSASAPKPMSPSSLSHLFINFLESESSPKSLPAQSPSTTHTDKVTGYIDPLTDPDRPSLSLLGSLSRPPLENSPIQDDLGASNKRTDVEQNAVQPTVPPISIGQTNVLSNQNSLQSSLLKSILSDSTVSLS